MRVTEGTNFEVIRDSMRRSKGRMENLQKQNATLKKLNAPSDDPVAASKLLELRTDKVNADQYQMNSRLAKAYLENTDHALSELSEIITRAKEIALSQASGASSNDSTRVAVAEEVSQLFQQAVSAANRRVGDRYIFGGYKTNKPPVDNDGRYRGDDGQMMVEISKDVFLSMNVSGLDAFNTNPEGSLDGRRMRDLRGQSPDSAQGMGRGPASERDESGEIELNGPDNINVFDELQNLRIGLLTGDLEVLRLTLERFDEVGSKLISMRAKVGARSQGIEASSASLDRQTLTHAQLSSNLEDADMAQVVSDLAKEETVFRSALASSQKLIQPTLMDFLK